MTPLAAVAIAGARGELREDNGTPAILTHPFVAGGALLLAIGEMAGDKQKTAPDRVVPIGLVARFTTSAIVRHGAGAATPPLAGRGLGGHHRGRGLLPRLARALRRDRTLRPDGHRRGRGCRRARRGRGDRAERVGARLIQGCRGRVFVPHRRP
ncbi:hypothetical protein AB5I41_20960 [Sphingomonas sp. MMS24-JH45]